MLELRRRGDRSGGVPAQRGPVRHRELPRGHAEPRSTPRSPSGPPRARRAPAAGRPTARCARRAVRETRTAEPPMRAGCSCTRRARRAAGRADGARVLHRRVLRRAARVGRAGRLGARGRGACSSGPEPLPRGRRRRGWRSAAWRCSPRGRCCRSSGRRSPAARTTPGQHRRAVRGRALSQRRCCCAARGAQRGGRAGAGGRRR